MSMTITYEEFDRKRREAGIGPTVAREFIEALGIAIVNTEPPEPMRELAREIVANANLPEHRSFALEVLAGDEDDHIEMKVAIAALRCVEKVVREAPRHSGLTVQQHTLQAIGAIE